MTDYTKYLLATKKDVDAFAKRNRELVAANREKFINWIKSLPLGRKVNYLNGVERTAIPSIIGIICLLYWEGAVNISFYDNASLISREPENMEEFRQWSKEAGFSLGTGQRENKK